MKAELIPFRVVMSMYELDHKLGGKIEIDGINHRIVSIEKVCFVGGYPYKSEIIGTCKQIIRRKLNV